MSAPIWLRFAACRDVDTNVFFIDVGRSSLPAKRICAQCPSRLACLEYALDNNERFGIYGGTTEKERQRMRRERRAA